MFKKIKNAVLYILGLRSPKKHMYFIQRTLWYQDELNYAEDGLVKEIIKDVLGNTFSEDKFGEAIGALYEKGMVPKLFAVVLKPYEPTILHRLWNAYFMPEFGIVPSMKNSEIAMVLSDFFVFNTRWMSELMTLLPGLLSKIPAMQTTMISRGMKS